MILSGADVLALFISVVCYFALLRSWKLEQRIFDVLKLFYIMYISHL